jgi:hypothetical protein
MEHARSRSPVSSKSARCWSEPAATRVEHDFEIGVVRGAEVRPGDELAVAAKHRRLSDLEAGVAGAHRDSVSEHGAGIHGQLVHRHELRGS